VKPYKILKNHYQKKKEERRSFSIRNLAKVLNISHSYTSQMLNGKRGIPLDIMERMCEILDVDKENRDFLIAGVFKEKGLSKTKTSLARVIAPVASKRKEWKQVSKKQFRLLVPWYVIAVADATLLQDYDGSPEWISKHLKLSLEAVKDSLRTLKDEGLLVENEGKWQKISRFIEFSSDISQENIRAFHQGQLDNAKNELTGHTSKEAREQRLISGMIITGSADTIEWAKQKLLGTIHEISTELAKSEAEKLFQLSVQFFPISKG
jgi:uncharacterized protein (TIGR02147 family)